MTGSRSVLILVLCCVCGPLAAQSRDGVSADDLIELSLGYGFGFPSASGLWVDRGSGGLTQGVLAEELVRRVFIQRELAERIFLDLDYDSQRQGGLFDGENVYSIQYRGLEDEFLQEISAGNRHLSIPGTRFLPMDEGNASSYALRTRLGNDAIGVQGLLRYSQAASGQKRFRGGSRLVETELLDVSYVKRRFFFLPDSGIDELSLRVYRSSDVPADRVIDGRDYALLSRGQDYRFDNSTGWIYLNRTLYEDEQLLVYYEKGGLGVGDGSLGSRAIIDESGSRVDFVFSDPAFSGYVGSDAGGTDYLYLAREIERDDDGEITWSFDGYWEIKSAYFLSEVYDGVFPKQIRIELFLTATGERNAYYDGLLGSYVVSSDYGALIFTFQDTLSGVERFYPRPFPGRYPFAPPYTPPDPSNPFDPANPVYGNRDEYGDPDEPAAEDSVNTLMIRYAVDLDSYFLDFDIIEGSVRVAVDGTPLSPASYTVDYYSGIITFAEGVVGPTSDIEVTYRYTPLLGGNQELLLAVGLDYEREWLELRNLTTFTCPLGDPVAPLAGQERDLSLANSTDLTISLGASPGEEGPAAGLEAGAAVAMGNENHKRNAVIADMEEAGLTAFRGDGGGIRDGQAYFSRIEQVAAEDPEVAGHAFSLSYPQVYADLHGSDSYRDRYGYAEQVLICELDPMASPLADGEAVYLRRGFGYLYDLSAYRELRVYLYLPPAQTIPNDASFSLVLIGSAADSLEITLLRSAIADGWNEIAVDLEPPCRVTVNGAGAGIMAQSGDASPLPRISEIRFGVVAGASGIDTAFTFWLDEWHLAGSRFTVDVALYGEILGEYRGEIAFLTDPRVSAALEHREGAFLDGLDRRRDAWSAAFDATLLRFVPLGAALSGYRESGGGLFRDPVRSLPPGLEDADSGGTYSHRIGIEAVRPFLPALEHRYRRSFAEDREVGISADGYLLDSSVTTGETISFTELLRYPEGLEQSYAFMRRWLYADTESLLVDTPPSLIQDSLDLTVTESHSGEISYVWERNTITLDLRREEDYEVAVPDPPAALLSSYAERMSSLFVPIPASHPGAALESREDRGRLFVNLPRQRVFGFSASMESAFDQRSFQADTGGRDLSVRDNLILSLPFSPGGKGILELIPRLSRGFSGSYKEASEEVQELQVLGRSWLSLLMPPFHYLSPRLDQGRLNEYRAVDLLAGSAEVAGLSEASLETSLALDIRLRDGPWYLPDRGALEVGSETGRSGERYSQSRFVSLAAGGSFFLGRGEKAGANRLRLDAGWAGGWDYGQKIVSHTLWVDTALDLAGRTRGRLTAAHSLSISRERQRLGDRDLLLFPDQPEREVEVPFVPDMDTVSSTLALEYSWERELDPRRLELLAASTLTAGLSPADAGRISHRQRLELENTFLIADRGELANTTVEPVRLLFSHESLMTVSQYLDLSLNVKTIGGVEEIISGGQSDYRPALGFELRLTGILNF